MVRVMTALPGFPVIATIVLCAEPQIDPQLEPFCNDAKQFDRYLRDNNFIPDDSITFRSGMILTRYRFLGDVLWMATLPNGRACLLPMGMLRKPKF
ncbi:hypothetical protein [Hyphomicrobium sp. DY-1]|jgi:hypothetical protein|uniref:hypothetical protein n=1 Tax=Hyphomicrobium sp. DY-1 TaxID=3075650 RepID=UPI0039C1B71F